MHLQRIRAQNFRAFGDGKTAPELDWTLSPGLNILIGENDAGKTAVVDAIRHVLWTTSYEFVRLFEQDFHIHGDTRAQSMFIEATLVDMSAEQEAAVLEWLTYEADGSRSLVLHMQARWIPPKDNKRGRVDVITRACRDGIGPEIGNAVRELVRATYLRPLRDAEAELKPARQSRLSQILGAHKSITGQEKNDFDEANPAKIPENLVGLMAFTQHYLGKHPVIKGVQDDINSNYLGKFAFAGDKLESRIQIAPDLGLQPILEKFELGLLPSIGINSEERCVRGLGYNKALFMATELVLLSCARVGGNAVVGTAADVHPPTLMTYTTDLVGDVLDRFGHLVLDRFNDDQLRRGPIKALCARKQSDAKQIPGRMLLDYWPAYLEQSKGQGGRSERLWSLLSQSAESGVGGVSMHSRAADAKRAVVLVLREADSPHIKGLRDGSQLFRRLVDADQDVKGIRQLCRELALAQNMGATEVGRAKAIELFFQCLHPLLPAGMSAAKFQALPVFQAPEMQPEQEANQRVCQVKREDRLVEIEIGTVASMKGETHLATLVLESLGHPSRRFDLAEALPVLAGLKVRDPKISESVLS